MAWRRGPMIVTWNECWEYIQLRIPLMSPFSNTIRVVFLAPICAITCKEWVVSLEFLKWATGFGKNVGITAEKPDYSFTRAVRGSFQNLLAGQSRMTGRPARYSCEFKYVLFFSAIVQGQLPNNFALKNSCAMFLSIRTILVADGCSWSAE